jgi:hypothetical protein
MVVSGQSDEGTTMQTTANRSRRTIWITGIAAASLLLAGCIFFGPVRPHHAVDLAPFKDMAKNGSCADIRNRLFVIDDRLVFWDMAGKCADASYSETLYGSTPDQVLCSLHDSIAGPMNDCQDEEYRAMFDTITANLDKPDLGLGPDHTVQPVPF